MHTHLNSKGGVGPRRPPESVGNSAPSKTMSASMSVEFCILMSILSMAQLSAGTQGTVTWLECGLAQWQVPCALPV
jgi:hypothetical protein